MFIYSPLENKEEKDIDENKTMCVECQESESQAVECVEMVLKLPR